MRRRLLTIALTGLFGALLLSSDASACCKRKRCAQPCAVAAPCPPPVCVKQRRHLLAGLCHKKQVCAAPVVCMAPMAPSYGPHMYPSGQASPQY